jgi:hypothetical protein
LNVYKLDSDANNYENIDIHPLGQLYDFSNQFAGNPLRIPLGKMKFKLRYPGKRPTGDFPTLIPNIPVFSRKAVESLKDMLEPNGELLPIKCDNENFLLFNVTRVIDALDEFHSVLKRFKCDGSIMDIDRHAFIPEKIKEETVFKIPQMVTMDVFVTDWFVHRVKFSRLKGFRFSLVWSDEKTR